MTLVIGVGAGAGVGLSLASSSGAGADAAFTVNDVGDSPLANSLGTACASTNVVSDTNTCTLRAALEAATNVDAPVTITLPNPQDATLVSGSAYVLDTADHGQLLISDAGGAVTIDGAGQGVTPIEGNATYGDAVSRVLKVNTGDSAVISGVTIENGYAAQSGEVGGGILNCGTLLLSNSTVIDNETNAGPGGGIYGELGTGTTTTLDNDTIQDNIGDDGGGLYAQGGTMTLDDTTVTGNRATLAGGGIFIEGQAGTATNFTMEDGSSVTQNEAEGGDGGGIDLGGTGNVNTVADIDASTIDNNTTDSNGGGLAQEATSTLTLTNSTVDGNSSNSDAPIDGGGLFLDGATSVDNLSNDTIGQGGETQPNTANEGGGVYVSGADPDFTNVNITNNASVTDGGGVYIEGGTSTFTGGSITDNATELADEDGGGVYIDGGTNTFSGVSITSNFAELGGEGGGFYVDGGTNTFTNASVNSNQAVWTSQDGGGEGGGFYYDGGTNTFTGGSIDSNTAYQGGGAYLDGGTETFNQADISSNAASESAAGLWISVEDVLEPTTITSSTISQNIIRVPIGVTSYVGDGGAIFSAGCNLINLTNDTIAANSAAILGGGYFGTECAPIVAAPNAGAHVVAEPPAVTTFLFDTIDANASGEGGGNINTDDSSVLDASETIVADGMSGGVEGDNCTFTGGNPLTSLGYNLIDDTTCGTAATGDIIGQSAQLGALGANGGPTNTELPATGSPAIAGVPEAVCTATGVSTDQRGLGRPGGVNGTCTIGAVEVQAPSPPAFNPNGYRLVANEGGIFDFGLNFNGSLANNKLNAPIVGLANSPGVNGYVMVGSDGGVFAEGGSNFYGSLGATPIPSPISAIAAPPSETGYWLVAQNGTIYNFGSVPALPAVSVPAGAHIVGMASTTDGGGAWLTDNLGDVYAEGDAQYVGGLGGVHINAPIVGLAAAASGQGYVLVASDGGVFNYGTQHFFGSVPGSLAPGQSLHAPIVGIAVTHSGNGYWEVGADGGVFTYGDAPFLGSIYTAIGNHPLNGPIVGIQHLGEAPS